jgi:uncharacterized damage-inducible protein DinB
MTPATLLTDAFGRVLETALAALDGLDDDALLARPAPEANSIAWLVWHLSRIQDDHVAEVAGREQVWTSEGYAVRFGLPFDDAATGYGFTADDVAAVRAGGGLLADYLRAVHARTVEFLEGVTEDDLDRVVDRSWDPPVTLGVRLVSVISDDLQHAGQAAYLRGLL